MDRYHILDYYKYISLIFTYWCGLIYKFLKTLKYISEIPLD